MRSDITRKHDATFKLIIWVQSPQLCRLAEQSNDLSTGMQSAPGWRHTKGNSSIPLGHTRATLFCALAADDLLIIHNMLDVHAAPTLPHCASRLRWCCRCCRCCCRSSALSLGGTHAARAYSPCMAACTCAHEPAALLQLSRSLTWRPRACSAVRVPHQHGSHVRILPRVKATMACSPA